jgi:hypothetical protein
MNNDTNENHNRRGKPSKHEQLEIERKLRSLFYKGVKPYQAVNETGYSPNTVKKYYCIFHKEIRDLEGSSFSQRCSDRKTSTCLGLDKQIEKLEKIQEELELKSKTGGTQDIKLYKLRISLSNSIADLITKRLGIANSPTYDDILEAMREVEKQK